MKLATHAPTIDPAHETPQTKIARGKLAATLKKVFAKQREKAAKKAASLLKASKADDFADDIYAEIEVDFLDIPVEAFDALEDSALAGVSKGLLELQYTDAKVINRINRIARDWASDRAAELVGMRYDDDGELIENPNAEWAITDTTREQLRVIVRDAFSDETKMPYLVERIREAGAFADWRADLIARTEVAHAQAKGNLAVWKETGAVESIQWLLSDDHNDSIGCDCETNEGEIVDVGDTFPSGDESPPAHPGCQCVATAVTVRGESEDEESE